MKTEMNSDGATLACGNGVKPAEPGENDRSLYDERREVVMGKPLKVKTNPRSSSTLQSKQRKQSEPGGASGPPGTQGVLTMSESFQSAFDGMLHALQFAVPYLNDHAEFSDNTNERRAVRIMRKAIKTAARERRQFPAPPGASPPPLQAPQSQAGKGGMR
jgi:hypothetical protein